MEGAEQEEREVKLRCERRRNEEKMATQQEDRDEKKVKCLCEAAEKLQTSINLTSDPLKGFMILYNIPNRGTIMSACPQGSG